MKCPKCGGKVIIDTVGTITRTTATDRCSTQGCFWTRVREVRWMQSRPDLKKNKR